MPLIHLALFPPERSKWYHVQLYLPADIHAGFDRGDDGCWEGVLRHVIGLVHQYEEQSQ